MPWTASGASSISTNRPLRSLDPACFSAFPYGQDDDSTPRAYEPNVDGYLTLTATMMKLLAGRDLTPRMQEALSGCSRALSPFEYVFTSG